MVAPSINVQTYSLAAAGYSDCIKSLKLWAIIESSLVLKQVAPISFSDDFAVYSLHVIHAVTSQVQACVVPITKLPSTWRTTAFQSLTWRVENIFVLPGVITSLCLDTVLACMGIGHLLLPAQLPGTHWAMICMIRRLSLTVSDVCLKLGCFQSTSTYSALEVSHFMRCTVSIHDLLSDYSAEYQAVSLDGGTWVPRGSTCGCCIERARCDWSRSSNVSQY